MPAGFLPILWVKLLRKVYILTYRQKVFKWQQSHSATIATVLVHWAGHFQCLKYKYTFQIKHTEAILSNSTRKLLYMEWSKSLWSRYDRHFVGIDNMI